MPDLYLGVDAGGTKTHAAVMDPAGRITGFAARGTGNWERVGLPGAVDAVRSAIDEAIERSGKRHEDVTAATLALAGVDWPADAVAIESVGGRFGLNCQPHIVNDAMAVLFAGTRDGVGCASVAGTGGKTVACDGNRTLSTLGIGIGEAGGAGQVVDEMVAILARVHHGQRPPSGSEAAVLAATGMANLSGLFYSMARDGWRMTEEFATTVFELAADGDALAVEAVEAVARQHAADVIGLADRLSFGGTAVPVVCAGGLHTPGSATFFGAFEAGLAGAHYSLTPVVLEVAPVVGALHHAFIRAGCSVTDQQFSRMLSSVRRWFVG